MGRLIDADALGDKVADLYTEGEEATEADKVVNDVIDLIDNAPTVERPQGDLISRSALKKEMTERPQGEWIPVSERLPKIDEENSWKASDVVLVCLSDEKIHMGFYCEDNKWRFCESGEVKEPFWEDVIAWMSLPKPYKEAENE